jgi:diaminopimelate decarboxylase
MSGEAPAAFAYRDGRLHCEAVELGALAARFGTPLYVYSRRAILASYERYRLALAGHRAMVCYAVKANGNLAVLQLLARAGSGFDIVSGGELARVLAAGARADRVVFSGVGKTEAEMQAALEAGIACFNVESEGELDMLDAVARRRGVRAPVSLRINPDVDPGTHPYISTGLRTNKFGIDAVRAEALYLRAAGLEGIALAGIDCHIGSQITAVAPYIEAAERVLDLVDRLAARGVRLQHIDFGGGLGIAYRADETVPPVEELVAGLLGCVARRGHADKTILLEPGRSIVGAAGALLTRVQVLKDGASKRFAVVDAAMNDLLRPALYDAWMDVLPVAPRAGEAPALDIVGPVCESADWLAHERRLVLAPGDLLAVCGAGAYGMSMASNYNARPRAAEVLVDGGQAHLVRRRETLDELFEGESLLP